MNARMEATGYPFENAYVKIAHEICDKFLNDHGCTISIKNSAYTRDPRLNDDQYCNEGLKNYAVEVLKEYWDVYPNIFEDFPQVRQNLHLNLPQEDQFKLWKYPNLVKAIFLGEENIP